MISSIDELVDLLIPILEITNTMKVDVHEAVRRAEELITEGYKEEEMNLS